MIVAIHQPAYFPWLGLLEKIAIAERFIILDNVQYNSRAFQHRTLYSRENGPAYLSLSVKSKGSQINKIQIKDIELADPALPQRHFNTLRHRYGKRPGWPLLSDALHDILSRQTTSLVELNLATLRFTLQLFEINTELILASQLDAEGAKSDLMLALTQAAGGDAYLSGKGARAYMNNDIFEQAGIELYWQSFVHPVFPQSHVGDFQTGCFALEWIIEEPVEAADRFKAHVATAARRIGLQI